MMPRSSISTFVLPLFFAFPSVLASTYQCTNFTIPVNVTAPSLQVAFPPFESHFDSIAFLLNLSSRNASSSSSSLFRGEANVTSTFNISSQYCIPANASSNDTGKVQVLTHGLGFNKDYWNFGGPGSQYNYIQAATNAGYSTFSYDRIGTGESSYPDPYDIAQGPTELVILATLTERLRLGLLAPHIPKPEKVLHVGHSFGSILIHGLAASAPNLTDGIVLTGYSTNGTWQTQWLVSTLFQLAKYHIPERFGNLSTGYLTWVSRFYRSKRLHSVPLTGAIPGRRMGKSIRLLPLSELRQSGTCSSGSEQVSIRHRRSAHRCAVAEACRQLCRTCSCESSFPLYHV